MDWLFKGSTPRGESLPATTAAGRSLSTDSLPSTDNLAGIPVIPTLSNASVSGQSPMDQRHMSYCCPLAVASGSGLVSLDSFSSQFGNVEDASKVADAHSSFWASIGNSAEEREAVLGDGELPEGSLALLMDYVNLFNSALGELKAPYLDKELIYLFFKKPSTLKPPRSRTSSASNLRESAMKKKEESPERSSSRPTADALPKAATPTRQFADMFSGNLFSQKSHQAAGTSTSTKAPPRHSLGLTVMPLAKAPFDGHPHEVVLSAIKGFRCVISEVVSALSESSDGTEFTLDGKTTERAFSILKHMEVLARYDGNRDSLAAHGVLDSVVTTLDLSAAALIRLDDRWDKDSLLDDGISKRMVDLKNLIISSMAILARTVDPESKWRKWVSSGGSEKFKTPLTSSSSRKPRLDSKFFHRVSDIITTILLYFSDASSEPSLVSFSIRIGALSTLGSLLIARPSTVRRHLLKSEGLKRLSEFLTYPSYIAKERLGSISPVTFRSEFRAQVLLWNILHLLTRISGTCLRRLEESNGFRGISSLFKWVAVVGEHFESDAEDFYPEFLLPMEDEKDPSFSLWAGEAGLGLMNFKRKEIRTLFSLALSVCTNTGNPIEQDTTEPTSSPIQSKFPKTHRPLLPDKEYSSEQSSHMERMLRILVNAFTEHPVITSPLHQLWTESEFDLRPLKITFLRFLRRLMRLDDMTNDSEIDLRDSVFVSRGLCIGWMESLGVWKLLFGPIFYDHPAPYQYLREDILDLFVLSSNLPELPNVGAISVLVSVVSPKAPKEGGVFWSIEDRVAACSALGRIVSVSSVTTFNSLRRAGSLDVFFPIAFDDSGEKEGPYLQLKETSLRIITDLTKAGPETAICIGGDRIYRQSLLKTYMDRFGTDDFMNIRFLLFYVTMQLLSLPGAGIQSSKNEDFGMALSIDTTISKNQLASEWMAGLLNCFPDSISDIKALELQADLLKMLRELMRSAPPGSASRRRIRHAMISARIFEHLLSILSVNVSSSEGFSEAQAEVAYHDLCANVINTIGIIITGSEFARKAFRDLQGYDEIRARILHKSQRSPWQGLLESFFGLLVPRWMPLSPTYPTNVPTVIRNSDVLHALVALFVDVSVEMQRDLLEKLEGLAKGHEMNRVVMSQVGLGMHLLKKVLVNCKTEELVAKCINVFEIIANYSITVAEAKALLRLLRHMDPLTERGPHLHDEPGPSWQNCLPPFYDALLRCVRKLAQRKEADLDFFYFSGKNSGIVLPKMEKWPPSSGGYSFFTWIKIEEGIDLELYASPGNGKVDSSVLSIRNEDGSGVELAIKDRQLYLTVVKGDKSHILLSEYKLSLRRWHFVAVCQTAPKFPWFGASEATIYVNGHLRAQGKLEYPDCLEYSINRIGASGWVPLQPSTPREASSSVFHEIDTIADVEEAINTPESSNSNFCTSSFCGQMASIYIVDEYLSTNQLASLFELGSNHSSQFRLEDAISYPDMEKTLFDGTLHNKISLHLYPTAIKSRWTKSFCFDVSPRRNAKAEMHNVISCSTRCLRSAIHALGGIEILLPLVTHLDYPLAPLDNPSNSGSLIEVSSAVRVERLSTFLRILGVLIGDDSGHCDRLAVIKGPKIVGMLLQQQNSCCLDMNTLDTMMALSKVALGASGPLSFAGELEADIQESLILDFRLWSMATTQTQLEYMEFLGHYLPTQLDRLRSRYGMIYILDVLETFYWNVPPDHLPPDLLARLILTRPESSHITDMRTELIKVMTNLTPNGIMQEELSRLLASLWMRRTDPVHVYDLLMFLMRKIVDGPGSGVLECLLAQGIVVELFFWLLSECSDESIRRIILNLMLLIIKVDRTPDKWRKKLRLEELPGNMFSPSPTLNFGQLGISFSGFHSKFQLTRKIYLSLLQLTLEEQILDWFSDNVIQSVDSLIQFRFRNVAYLSCLLDLIHKTFGGNALGVVSPETLKLGLDVLRDLTTLMKIPPNAETLRRIYGWQALLFQALFSENPIEHTPSNVNQENEATPEAEVAIEPKGESLSPVAESEKESEPPLAEVPEQKPEIDDSLKAQMTEFNDAVLRFIAVVIYDAFESDKKAWRLIEETTALAWLLRRLGEREQAIKFIRRLVLFILREVRREIGVGHAGIFSSIKTENIWHLLLLSEEMMFHHHDLRDSLLGEVKAMASNVPTELAKASEQEIQTLFYEIGKNRLPPRIQNLSRRDSDDVIVRISYPFEECREIVEECLEILSSFVEYGITHVNLSENEKSHNRVGGLLRLELRILLSALSIPDNNTWLVVLPYLMPLLDKHAQSYADTQSRQRILHIIGAIHNAFMLGLNAKNDPIHQDLDYHVILPLYMLLISRWQDYILTLKNVEGVTLVKQEALSESEKSDDNFIRLVTSANWEYIYDHHLFPALKQIEQEEFSIIPLAIKRYVKVVRTLYVRSRKEEIAAYKGFEVTYAHVKAIASRKINEEISRMSEKVSNHEIERRSIMRQWLNNYRALTEERAIWAPPKFDLSKQKWKLDRAENFLRMRPRLTQNYEFDDHRDAAARRDKVHVPGIDLNLTTMQSSPRIERAMMAHTAAAALASAAADRRKAQVEKLRMHFESGSTNDLMREVSEGSLGSRVTEEDLEDEWNVVADDDHGGQSTSSSLSNLVTIGASGEDAERFICGADCELILLMTAVKGRLELFNTHLSFRADLRRTAADLNEADQRILALLAESEVLIRERRWTINNLREVYLRRYMLRNSALEFFFVDRTNHLFNFKQAKDRIKFMTKITQLRPLNLVNAEIRSPPEIAKRSDYTERWQRHEISNFEYLMYLNTVSGRTYSDLTQYPVFPWILADYTTKTLDLNDPKSYRDLSKPIGALNESRLEQYLERFRQFEDPSGTVKKFLYGTHYSTSAAVLFYLIRLEPFASLHIALQAGKFDHPDRQFHSMDGCWKSVFTGNSDVKELIPEFFYMPDFLLNENEFDLGRKQTGATVNDVVLPEWASSPEEFIRIHREALEGDYVSEHLHEWIDLIWGYKQTGEEAVKANNVFYYLTYEGAINIDSVKDPVERKSIEDQINNFGQTPSQLFTKPHPQRLKRESFIKPTIFSTPQNHKSFLISLKGSSIQYVACSRSQITPEKLATGDLGTGNAVQFPPFISQMVNSEKQIVVTADTSLTVGLHRWFETNVTEQTYQFDMDPGVFPKRSILSQFALNINMRPGLFSVSRDCKYMFSAGHWDSSFHLSSIDVVGAPPRSIDIVYGHHDIVTCLTISEDGRTLVTGSRDTTAMAWELLSGMGDGILVRQDNRRIFYGHDDEVTTVAANVEHDLLVSGSKVSQLLQL
ncbi:Neurobeachin-like protein 1 [Dinochytrium kinnereticum]|nr:Neurobeachin-like protein 1 [Dinochytrium kinnereticum]